MEPSYFGIVSLSSIENVWPSTYKQSKKREPEAILTEKNIKLVHYPDCQQLIIWLPTSYREYQDMVINDLSSGNEIWREEISQVVSGNIQIILDTLSFSPGDFTLKITKKDGVQHIVVLKKYEVGIYPEKPVITPEELSDDDKAPIVYRDGFGNIIPDQDLILREQVINEMYRKFTRKVTYEGSGRSNTVIYIDGDKTIRLYSEMGGGNCLFYIDIPTKEKWEKETGFRLDERGEIIQFIAENILRDQTTSSGAYFEIEDKWITFYKSKK